MDFVFGGSAKDLDSTLIAPLDQFVLESAEFYHVRLCKHLLTPVVINLFYLDVLECSYS
jgi:hypothetical protein